MGPHEFAQPVEPPTVGGAPVTPPWSRLPRVGRIGPIVVQSDPDGCGPACGSMLLADRGLTIAPEFIGTGLAVPCGAQALAFRLNEVCRGKWRWVGGALDTPMARGWDQVALLTRVRGSWSALLEPHGHRHVGHWVVVDGVSDLGVVNIRDPAGSAYGIPIEEFESLWNYGILVLEARS